MDLECQFPRDGVLPNHGHNLNSGFVDGREVGRGEFGVVRVEPQTVGEGFGGGHPDVRVWCVLDFRSADEFLVLGRGGRTWYSR